MNERMEIEECTTCGEKKPIKYRIYEYPEPGVPEGPFYQFCSDECLVLWVKAFKSWNGLEMEKKE